MSEVPLYHTPEAGLSLTALSESGPLMAVHLSESVPLRAVYVSRHQWTTHNEQEAAGPRQISVVLLDHLRGVFCAVV